MDYINTPDPQKLSSLLNTLEQSHTLPLSGYEYLITHRSQETASILAEKAASLRRRIYGNTVYIRGLIEISNICKNNCLYCGIRKDNRECSRYRLTAEEILECCAEGYALGFRTFVLQSGEDPALTDEAMCSVIRQIKQRHPDCAITLSLGERSRSSYQRLFDAGADRYLLRHETANASHYRQLHPPDMSFDRRMQSLQDLRAIGYQTGCGFMVGSPYQTAATLAQDLKFIETFRPDMCGIGPFIPHKATPLRHMPAGDADLTCFLLSILRLIHPLTLRPATTALGTIAPDGREKGILAGANVIMPNLSPCAVRKKYELYNNKLCSGAESAQGIDSLAQRMAAIGYEIVTDRGDAAAYENSRLQNIGYAQPK